MAGGGKGGGGGGSGVYDYYGTIAGVVCDGPVDELLAIIIDGKEAWPGSAQWKVGLVVTAGQVYAFGGRNWQVVTGHTTTTGNQPPGGNWIAHSVARGASVYTDITVVGYGTCRIYWGTASQIKDPDLTAANNDAAEDHPSYRNTCYIILKNFLFGRERTSAPNVEVVVHRKPVQSVVTSTPTNLSDGQSNLMTAVLEAATSVRNGIGILPADIDTTTMQAVAQSIATAPDLWFGSVILSQQTTINKLASEMALLSDSHIWLNPASKKLEAVQFLHGAAPSSYVTITTNDLTETPSIDSQSWQEVPTGAVVVFSDRERAYKQTSDKVDDLRAVSVVGENRRENLTRDSITRRAQALNHASEHLRRFGRPQMSARITVRREKARTITPGSWVLLDIDLEPNGAQLLQFFKVIEVNIPNRGPISIELDAEETLAPTPYTPPATIGNVPVLGGAEAIPAFRVFEASYALAGAAGRVGCLAQRPNLLSVGFQLSYNSASTGTFQNLGIHDGFAVKATIRADYSASATGALQIAVPTQADISILSQSLTSTVASDDSLLAVVFRIATGQIDVDAAGLVHWEIMSVSAISIVSAGNYDLTVTRARQGTAQHAFVVASAEVWIVNRSSLKFFFHQDFEKIKLNKLVGLTPDTAYFIPQPFTAYDTLDIDSITPFGFAFNVIAPSAPVVTINLPTWTEQTFSNATLATDQIVLIQGTVVDYGGRLAEVQIVCRKDGGPEVTVYRAVTGRNSASFSYSHTFTDSAGDVGLHQFIVRAISINGEKAEKGVTVICQAASVTLTPPVTNAMGFAGAGAPAWAQLGGVGLLWSGQTYPRDIWNYMTIAYSGANIPASVLATGMVKVVASATTVTTAPASGWIDLNVIRSGSPYTGFFSQKIHNLPPLFPGFPSDSTDPVGVINAIYTGNAPFKLWVKCTNPGDTDSSAIWIIFSGPI